jgi:tetratricopeptide (TPR) repeat protein
MHATHLRLIFLFLLILITPTLVAAQNGAATRVQTIEEADRAFAEKRYYDALRIYGRLDYMLDARIGAGKCHEALNRPDKAAAEYQAAIRIDPLHYYAYELLGNIQKFKPETIGESVRNLELASKLHPSSQKRRDLEQTIAILKSHLRDESEYAVGSWTKGNAAYRLGKSEEAEKHYSTALDLNPRMYQAHFSRGLLHFHNNNFEAAVSDFIAAVKIAPTMRGAYVKLGQTWEKLDDKDKALECFTRAVELDPKDPEAHFLLGMATEPHSMGRAMRLYVEALKLRPKNPLETNIKNRIVQAWNSGKYDPKRDGPVLEGTKDLW